MEMSYESFDCYKVTTAESPGPWSFSLKFKVTMKRKDRGRDLPTSDSIQKWMLQSQNRTSLQVCYLDARVQGLQLSYAGFPGKKQGNETEMEHQVHEMEFLRNADTAGRHNLFCHGTDPYKTLDHKTCLYHREDNIYTFFFSCKFSLARNIASSLFIS